MWANLKRAKQPDLEFAIFQTPPVPIFQIDHWRHGFDGSKQREGKALQLCILAGGTYMILRGEVKKDQFIIRLLDGVTAGVSSEWQPFCQHYCYLAGACEN